MPKLEIKLLGHFQVSIGNQPITKFRSDKVRALLIYLAIEGERPLRRETLAGLLWPDFPQKSAQSNLRKSLYHLRQAIDNISPGFSDHLLTITRQTIQIFPEMFQVDFNQFQDNLAAIKQHRHQHLHNCGQCLAHLKNAVDLYHGDFAAGFSLADASTFESWLLIQRESSQQETLSALDHLTAAAEMNGEYEQAHFYANQQLILEPWRENAYRQLMRILALDGRRSEALAQYENCRQTLWEELEVEPAAETKRLLEAIKNGTFVPQTVKTNTQLHHFPTQFIPFIGRKSELSEIVERLSQDDCRLLTLVGPGGIGKTRLSIEAAQQLAKDDCFKDGIYFISLAAISDGDVFLLAIAAQLDMSMYGRSNLLQYLQRYLADQEVLLVLDNFEQLRAESGLITQLLETAPKLKILLTSRVALNIRAEQRLVIEGLADESAVDLFGQAANKAWPAYRLQEQDRAAILEVCRLVAGIPLAVEMAAGWVKTLDAATIARQIKDNFDFLTAPFEEQPERHQSMRVVFEESWKLLNTAEQKALAQFSLFKGGFSLYAALETTEATINEVAALLDKSLLAYTGKSRYQLHELLRQFAQTKLVETIQEETRKKHQHQFTQYYLQLVNRSEGYLYGKSPQIGIAEIQAEFDNILQAWQFAIQNQQLDLVSTAVDGLWMFFRVSGGYREGFNQFSAAIGTLSGFPENQARDRLLCHLLINAADFGMLIGEMDLAEKFLAQAREISTRENWLDTLADVDKATSDLFYQQSKFIHSSSYVQKAIAYYESVGDHRKLVDSSYRLGVAFQRSDRWQDTAKLLGKALNLAESLEYNWAVVMLLWALGYLYREKGRRELSLEYHEKSIQMALEINYIFGVHRAYISAGLNYEDMGYNEKALQCYQLATDYAQEISHTPGLSRSIGCIGRVFWHLNRLEEALDTINQALALSRQLGYKIIISWQLIVKAEILFALGRFNEAWPINEEGLALCRETTLKDRVLQSRILRTRLHVALGRQESAVNELNEMLSPAEDTPTLAAAHYQLWKMTAERSHAGQALNLYREIVKEDPFIVYKDRIVELEKYLGDG